MSLRKVALSTAAMSSVSVLRLLAQFFVVPILARFLSPADYGVVTMAMPFLLFTMIFTDAGIGLSLVRTAGRDERLWSSTFWLACILGVVLMLLIMGVAPLAAWFFGEPRLLAIILALAVVVLPQAIATIPGNALQKDQRFGTIAGIEITSVGLGLLAAVIVAFRDGGAWALVIQQLVQFSCRMLLTLTFSSFRPRLTFSATGLREHLLFGRDVIGTGILNFLAQSIDTLIIGKALGSAQVGIYAMAFLFARLPARVITGPLQYVIYSHLNQFKDDMPAVGLVFILLSRVLAILVFPAIALVAAAHEPVFRILLSAKWAEAGELFALVAPAIALQSVTAIFGTFRMAIGRTDLQLRATFEFASLWLGALLIASWQGLDWAAYALNAVTFLYLPRAMYLLLPQIACSVSGYLRCLAVPAAASLAGVLLYHEATSLLHPGDWMAVFIGASLSVVAIALSAVVQLRALKAEASLWQKAAARSP